VTLASEAADRNIGLTVLGVGTDLNQELVLAISELRGGNYLFLLDSQKISSVFDDHFDYLVTPLAGPARSARVVAGQAGSGRS
jgi:Ca-activated chloride channel family protein